MYIIERSVHKSHKRLYDVRVDIQKEVQSQNVYPRTKRKERVFLVHSQKLHYSNDSLVSNIVNCSDQLWSEQKSFTCQSFLSSVYYLLDFFFVFSYNEFTLMFVLKFFSIFSYNCQLSFPYVHFQCSLLNSSREHALFIQFLSFSEL